jgi:multidrug efflux pump subunit AcrB
LSPGVIIIDYVDNRIASGMDKMEAIVQAGVTRLTPALLTALSTILGLVPLAIGPSDLPRPGPSFT